MTIESLVFSKKSSDILRCFVYVAIHTVALMLPGPSLNPVGKVSTRSVQEQSGDECLKKYRLMLDDKVNFTSTNSFFRKNNHAFATNEIIKKKIGLHLYQNNCNE